MSLLDKLRQHLETKPLVLLRFEEGYGSALSGTRHGLDRFTEVRGHESLEGVKPPTLCLAEIPYEDFQKLYVGVIKSKAAIATFDTRVTIIKLKPLTLAALTEITGLLGEKIFDTLLSQKLEVKRFATALSPKLSAAIIDALIKDSTNKSAIEAAAGHIPKLREISIAEWEQFDAIKTAMAAFGLSKSDFPATVEIAQGSDSTLNYLEGHSVEDPPWEASVLEDNVIAKDASMIPGFDLVEKHMTGRAVFYNAGERLEVYTANKGPLEEMLGVDLIYINESAGNAVMVQYKMLSPHSDSETAKTDWIFRPDEQFRSEVDRMKLPDINGNAGDYRLHRSPFFFKFVKRKGDGEKHSSFVVALEHLNHFLDSPKSKGPKGGARVSFDSLGGVYLRETDLLGLIRSGYIGTHRIETEALKPIIQAVSEGRRALVLAWQTAVQRASEE